MSTTETVDSSTTLGAKVDKQTKAQFDHRIRLNRHNEQARLAQQLAPAFRDKYDFSGADDFKNWAELCFKAADALLSKGSALMADESKRYEKELEDERKKEAAT